MNCLASIQPPCGERISGQPSEEASSLAALGTQLDCGGRLCVLKRWLCYT